MIARPTNAHTNGGHHLMSSANGGGADSGSLNMYEERTNSPWEGWTLPKSVVSRNDKKYMISKSTTDGIISVGRIIFALGRV